MWLTVPGGSPGSATECSLFRRTDAVSSPVAMRSSNRASLKIALSVSALTSSVS